MKLKAREGITLVELVIVIVIILTLAAIGVQQSSGIQKLLSFNNAFQKTLYFVQRARTLALTRTEGSYDSNYEVRIDSDERKISLYESDALNPKDSFQLPSLIGVSIFNAQKSQCNRSVQIEFARDTGSVKFDGCDKTNAVTIKLCQIKNPEQTGTVSCESNEIIRSKSFKIHKASGVPQM